MVKHIFLLKLLLLSWTSSLSQQFQEVSEEWGIEQIHTNPWLFGGGVAMIDIDNNGFLDLYVTGGTLNKDKLYLNKGDHHFEDYTLEAGLGKLSQFGTMGVAVGDVNNDGFDDLFITTDYSGSNFLFLNNGDKTFTDVTFTHGIVKEDLWSTSASFGDYNNDGFLDLYVVNYLVRNGTELIYDENDSVVGFNHSCSPNHFYINKGDGIFTESAEVYGVDNIGCGLAVTFTDFDKDNDQDIYVVNDFGEWVVPNSIYVNNYPIDSFTGDPENITGMNVGIYGMGIAKGDYDGDGDLDYYTTNIGKNVLLNNSGNGILYDSTDFADVANTYTADGFSTSWGAAFFDFNNDTKLDLFVSNGEIPSADFIKTGLEDPNSLFSNNGDGTFTEIGSQLGLDDTQRGRGLCYGDLDNDGDLDIINHLVDHVNSDKNILIYENMLNDTSNWVALYLRGSSANLNGFGTRIEAFVDSLLFIREVDGGSSHLSHNSHISHIGLGKNIIIDSILVYWPGEINPESFYNIESNYIVHIIQNYHGAGYRHYSSVSICDNDSLIGGSGVYVDSGEYIDKNSVTAEKDSIVYLNISTMPSYAMEKTITLDYGDSVYLAGNYQRSEGIYFDSLLTVQGCDSILITTIDKVTGFQANQIFDEREISVYPTPTNSEMNIKKIDDQPISNISVFNLNGIEIYHRAVNTINAIIDCSDFTSGLYIIQINSDNKFYRKKFIVNK